MAFFTILLTNASTPPIYSTPPSPFQPSPSPLPSSQGLAGGAELFFDTPSPTVLEEQERGWAREHLLRHQILSLSLSTTPSYHESHSSQNPLAWASGVSTAVETSTKASIHPSLSPLLTPLSSLTPLPSIGARAPSSSPIRRRRGSIVPEDDFWDGLNQVQTQGRAFRFGAKTYFLTWSQIGNLPNSALEDKMASFGNHLKSESLCT